MTTLSRLSKEYVDVDFSFEKHPLTNNISIKKNINAVKQSIIHLLTLKEGDKPFHPEIKSPIYDYLFESTAMVTQIVLEEEIRKYISVFEPRVQIIKVSVSFADVHSISCDISAYILNTSEPFNVSILINRLR